jgi:two-component system NtrC family sensor kinase
MRLCQGDHAQLYLREGDRFVIFSQVGSVEAAHEYSRQHPHSADRTTVIGRVALTREVVQIPDVLADPEYSFGAQAIIGFGALLGVPIVLDEELIGALAVGEGCSGPVRGSTRRAG